MAPRHALAHYRYGVSFSLHEDLLTCVLRSTDYEAKLDKEGLSLDVMEELTEQVNKLREEAPEPEDSDEDSDEDDEDDSDEDE